MAKLFIRYYISTDIVFGEEWKKYSSKKEERKKEGYVGQ